VARELADRLPALRPDRYRVIAPRRSMTGPRGHVWEQLALPARARGSRLILCPANLAPVATRRSVVMIYDLAPFVGDWYSPAYARWYRALVPRVARRARLVITTSQLVRRQLSDLLGVDPGRIATVPLGVDERFGESPDHEPVTRRLGLERPYVLAMGTDLPRKNLALLDRIGPRLAAEGFDVVLAGSTRTYMPTGTYRARRVGYVDDADLPGLYSGAAALAMPSLYEGFGLGCLEAMAAGTPVVASDRGALPETCGDAALLVDPADEDAFADALLLAAAPGAARDRLVSRGRERAREFTWARTAERVDACLDPLLAPTGGSAPTSAT
jgi:glycosyltransferase involved in cell wall biosynthesis